MGSRNRPSRVRESGGDSMDGGLITNRAASEQILSRGVWQGRQSSLLPAMPRGTAADENSLGFASERRSMSPMHAVGLSKRLCGMRTALGIVLVAVGAAGVGAQSVPAERPRARPPSELTGWADWEKAEAMFRRIPVPPAPPLTPEQALQTFKVAPGFRLELVAAEPMVQNPIFFEFDPDGRIWVVEYQGYMRDLKGSGEADPICRVVVLEDLDEDGRADRSTVFLDGLVMPRSLAFVQGGVLVAEPPALWFCRDTDGDLRCDEKSRVGSYGRAGNPQHTANGLRYGLDNWLHSADWPRRHRFADGKLIEEDAVQRGQFGVTFDDLGRFLTCYESSALHGDLIPEPYLRRNPNFLKAYHRGGGDRLEFGVNVNLARDAAEVFPIRPTPQITLGALELRDDGRLRTYTVVAGICFYNGDQFPADAYGNVFVPEAGGHLVGRLKLAGDLAPRATRFYPAEQELLASTDERFRPVGARVGPDGALYLADMYKGIIEHVIFLAPWLEKQIKERHLETGNDLGRIYRVVFEGKPIARRRPALSRASSAELVAALGHANGWWRLTAQRLLVERRDPAALPALRSALREARPLGRLHALWTLHGMDALDWATALTATEDADARVRAAALRLSEELATIRAPDAAGADTRRRALLDRLSQTATDPSPLVRLQTTLSAGAFPDERAASLLAELVEANEHPLFRAAALTGVRDRELKFLQRLAARPTWQPDDGERSSIGERLPPHNIRASSADREHRRRLVTLLTQAILDSGAAAQIEPFFDWLGDFRRHPAWLREAAFEGLDTALPRDLQHARPLALARAPAALLRWTRDDDPTLRQRAFRWLSCFTWPGAGPLRAASVDLTPLSAEEQRRLEAGQKHYALVCAACHQPHGGGLPAVAPPLIGSDWVHGPAERLARIVLHGLYGPIEVNGLSWNLHMPGFGAALDDEQIAAVLTYVRRAWGNVAPPVSPAFVAAARQATAGRELAWTAEELSVAAPAPATGGGDRTVVRPDEHGALHLPAHLAATYGRELAYRPSLDVLAPWRREQDVAEWLVEAPAPGAFEVRVTLAADDLSAGDQFVIETESSRVTGTVRSSGGYDRFHEYAVGKLVLRAGLNRVVMRPEGPLNRELADVRALRLLPLAGDGGSSANASGAAPPPR